MKQSNLSDLLDRIEVALYGCLASPTNGPHAALVVLAAIRREECGEESFPFSIRQRDEIAEAEARNVREELEKLIAGQKAEDDEFNRLHPQQQPAEEPSIRHKLFGRKKKDGEEPPNAALEGDEVV